MGHSSQQGYQSQTSQRRKGWPSEVLERVLIIVLPADKGKATVVMHAAEYEDKVKEMLADERTYTKLSNDPTPKYRKKLLAS